MILTLGGKYYATNIRALYIESIFEIAFNMDQ